MIIGIISPDNVEVNELQEASGHPLSYFQLRQLGFDESRGKSTKNKNEEVTGEMGAEWRPEWERGVLPAHH